MRFIDIMRQKVWVRQCKYYVWSVSPPEETVNGGLCQTLDVADTTGNRETLNYFYDGADGEIKSDFVGEQWLDVRWTVKGYYQCVPVQPAASTPLEEGRPDWYKINTGKCRHGIMCAAIQSGKYSLDEIKDSDVLREFINKLAEFSMTGEIAKENEE